jgi:hypothetical protein
MVYILNDDLEGTEGCQVEIFELHLMDTVSRPMGRLTKDKLVEDRPIGDRLTGDSLAKGNQDKQAVKGRLVIRGKQAVKDKNSLGDIEALVTSLAKP